MNELSADANGTSREDSPNFSIEQVRVLLAGAKKPTKVIAGARRGVFTVDADDIENFFHLVEQRVSEQSSCALEKFEAIVYLNNGTSRRLSAIGDFKGYTQLNSSFPTLISIHISWLILFPDTASPERQEIDITIRASDNTSDTLEMQVAEDGFRMATDRVQLKVDSASNLGLITYSINHSRISWGLDIENHVTAHIDKIMQLPSKFERIVRKSIGPLNLFTSVFVGLYLTNLLIDLMFILLYATEPGASPTTILEVATRHLVNGHIAKYIVSSLLLAVVVMVLFSGAINRLLRGMTKPRPSFIILSKHNEDRKVEKLRQYEKRWTSLFAVLAMNIVVVLVIALAEDRFLKLVHRFWE